MLVVPVTKVTFVTVTMVTFVTVYTGYMRKVTLICAALAVVAGGFFLKQVFSGAWALPQTISVGFVTLHYYGITMALALASAWYFAVYRAPRFGLASEWVDAAAVWLALGGFAGARLYHVFSSFGYYTQNPVEVFMVWHGGLSIFGALLGGFAALLGYLYFFRKQSATAEVWGWLDVLAPAVLLGQIVGRFGNLFNYEAFGYPTALPWKMFVPEVFRPVEFAATQFFHPLFLYEAGANALIFAFLWWYARPSGRTPLRMGAVFSLYIILYNTVRFFLEHLRTDSTFLSPQVRLNAVASALLVVVGSAIYFYVRRYGRTYTRS